MIISAALYSPCILLLQSVHAIGRDRDGNTEGESSFAYQVPAWGFGLGSFILH